MEAATLTAVVTTAGLLGGGGGLTAGARSGRCLAPPPRLDWEADLVTPGGLLGSGGPVLLRPAAGAESAAGATAFRLGLWLDGGGAGGGPRGLTSAGKGEGAARRTGGVSLGSGGWAAVLCEPPTAGLEEKPCRGPEECALVPEANSCPVPHDAFPVGRNLGMPPAKSPANPGGAPNFPEPFDDDEDEPPFLAPSITGALRSLVTAFFNVAPPRICDSRADRSGVAAVFPSFGGPSPPIRGGGGGGGGGMALAVAVTQLKTHANACTLSLCHFGRDESVVTNFPRKRKTPR